jgi:hypothetical protein
LQEYRFQIQLNWDRTKHYLTFNTCCSAPQLPFIARGLTEPPKRALRCCS